MSYEPVTGEQRVGTKGLEPSSPATMAWCPTIFGRHTENRGGRIRTCTPLVPNQVRYQIALHLADSLGLVFGFWAHSARDAGTLECAVSRPGRDSSSLPGALPCAALSEACARRLGGGSSRALAVHRAAPWRQNGCCEPVGPCLDTHRSVFRRPQLERYRIGSGSGRRRRRHTGSGRPARSWSCNVDPRMLRAVVITDALMSSMNLLASYAAVKHSFRFF